MGVSILSSFSILLAPALVEADLRAPPAGAAPPLTFGAISDWGGIAQPPYNTIEQLAAAESLEVVARETDMAFITSAGARVGYAPDAMRGSRPLDALLPNPMPCPGGPESSIAAQTPGELSAQWPVPQRDVQRGALHRRLGERVHGDDGQLDPMVSMRKRCPFPGSPSTFDGT